MNKVTYEEILKVIHDCQGNAKFDSQQIGLAKKIHQLFANKAVYRNKYKRKPEIQNYHIKREEI